MKVKRYKTKVIEKEALLYDGNNWHEVREFAGKATDDSDGPPAVATNSGLALVSVGDYVIKGPKGEFYPCRPDIFEQGHEEVE